MTLGIVGKTGECSCSICDWKSSHVDRERAKHLILQHLIDQHQRTLVSFDTRKGITRLIGVSWK